MDYVLIPFRKRSKKEAPECELFVYFTGAELLSRVPTQSHEALASDSSLSATAADVAYKDDGDSSQCDSECAFEVSEDESKEAESAVNDTGDEFNGVEDDSEETEDAASDTEDEFKDVEDELEEPEDAIDDAQGEYEALESRKRPRKCQQQHHGPAQKKIRMQRVRGTAGYAAEIRSQPSDERPVLFCAESSHVDLSKPCPSTPTTRCPILIKLQMYFGPYGFVCSKCGYLYPPSHLHQHIFTKHKMDLDITSTGKNRKRHYELVVAHLLSSHGVPEGVQSFDLPETVTDMIPGLKVALSYQCPECPTPSRWFIWDTLRKHYAFKHEGIQLPSKTGTRSRHIIRPYRLGSPTGGRSELTDVVMVLPEDWMPPKPLPLRPSSPTTIRRERVLLPSCAPHLVAIGWSEYLRSLNGADIQFLMKLVELPSEKDVATFPYKRAALEKGILGVNQMLSGYLADANLFLESCHLSVRKAITSGCAAISIVALFT